MLIRSLPGARSDVRLFMKTASVNSQEVYETGVVFIS